MQRRRSAPGPLQRVVAIGCVAAGVAVLAVAVFGSASVLHPPDAGPAVAAVAADRTLRPTSPATSSTLAPSTSERTTAPTTPGASPPTPSIGSDTTVAPDPADAEADGVVGRDDEQARDGGTFDALPPVERGAAVVRPLESRAEPVGIVSNALDLDAYPVRPIGLTDDGELEIPGAGEIGWYRYGATARSTGAMVLAAHVTWNGRTGPFFELATVELGARFDVELDDGTARTYEVIERARYEKDELPRERIWRTTGPETLVLITCGGDFNRNVRRYRHNIVVYATPVA